MLEKVKTDFFEETIAVDAWLDCICIPNRLEHSRLSAVMATSVNNTGGEFFCVFHLTKSKSSRSLWFVLRVVFTWSMGPNSGPLVVARVCGRLK